MKTLTLLRHAKSSWDDSDLSDHERPLNNRGARDAPEMAQRMHQAAIRPSLIISSPARRTWETAKALANELSYPLEFLQRDNKLYLASVDTLIDYVGQQDIGFNNVVVVGHNPGITNFANFLCPGVTQNMPTCGVVSVTIDSDDWDLRKGRTVTLDLYDYPKRLSTRLR